MFIERIGVHESVKDLFPTERPRDEPASVARDVAVVGDGAVVTFAYSDFFLAIPFNLVSTDSHSRHRVS